jgi:hypothetical protein
VAWSYTPRQIFGYRTLMAERLKREAAHDLALHATAAQGSGKAIQKQIKDLQKG